MSLNRVTVDTGTDILVRSVSVRGDFNYSNPANGNGLTLETVDVADPNYDIRWDTPNVGASNLYINQTELIIRSASYTVDNEPIYFNGFKFSQPSYVSLVNADRALRINSPGWYMVTYTIASPTLNTSTEYRLVLSDRAIPGGTMSTIPSALGYGSANQHITSTASCVFKVTAASTLELEISPSVITAIESDFSNFTLIRLRDLAP